MRMFAGKGLHTCSVINIQCSVVIPLGHTKSPDEVIK